MHEREVGGPADSDHSCLWLAEQFTAAPGHRGQCLPRLKPGLDQAFDFPGELVGAAISNIAEAGGRAQALHEAVRVLRPGGRLRIVDEGAGRYAGVLRDVGCTDVAVRQLDLRTWYGLPGHHMTLVAADQPRG